MKKILIVLSHPSLETSFANKTIYNQLKNNLPSAEFVHLDSEYPDGQFDVEKEQQRLAASDVIVMQFPMFWYSVPGLMKKWIDDIFVHGFAHGSKGNKLHGKKLLFSFTTGGAKELYAKDNYMEHSIEEFLAPLFRWAKQCGLELLPYIHTDKLPYDANEQMRNEMKERLNAHIEKVIQEIKF